MTPAAPWIVRFAPRVAVGARVLDMAAGRGRHSLLFLDRGALVTAVDINVGGLDPAPGLTIIEADLESGSWPFEAASFDAIIVSNYLYRPVFPAVRSTLAAGGLILYDTFAAGNEAYGKPSNPDFLLRPGELKTEFGKGFTILSFEEGLQADPKPAMRQSIAAIKTT